MGCSATLYAYMVCIIVVFSVLGVGYGEASTGEGGGGAKIVGGSVTIKGFFGSRML